MAAFNDDMAIVAILNALFTFNDTGLKYTQRYY